MKFKIIAVLIIIFVLGVIITNLKLDEFRNESYLISMGMILVLYALIPSLITTLIHFQFKNNKDDSEKEILDVKQTNRIKFHDLFYYHLIVFALIALIYKLLK